MATIQKSQLSDGSRRYRVRVRVRGEGASKTCSRLADAREWAEETERRIRAGDVGAAVQSQERTFSDAVERYLAEVLPYKSLSSQVNQWQQLKHWAEVFGALPLANITPNLIGIARGGLQPRSNGTINRYLAALSHLFTVAVKEWRWATTNPVRDVFKLPEPPGRVRYLSRVELPRLLWACRTAKNPLLLPAVVLTLSTGGRKWEVLGLTWERVDFARERVIFNKTKNGDTRAVTMTGRAAVEMRRLFEQARTRWCFARRDGAGPSGLRYGWQQAVQVAGLEDFRFHDLRHSAASYLAMEGARPQDIAEVLGHRTLAMVKRYAHLSELHTAGVVGKMNRAIFEGGEG